MRRREDVFLQVTTGRDAQIRKTLKKRTSLYQEVMEYRLSEEEIQTGGEEIRQIGSDEGE